MPTPITPKGIAPTTTEQFAMFIVESLVIADAVKKDDFKKAVGIMVEEVNVRKATYGRQAKRLSPRRELQPPN